MLWYMLCMCEQNTCSANNRHILLIVQCIGGCLKTNHNASTPYSAPVCSVIASIFEMPKLRIIIVLQLWSEHLLSLEVECPLVLEPSTIILHTTNLFSIEIRDWIIKGGCGWIDSIFLNPSKEFLFFLYRHWISKDDEIEYSTQNGLPLLSFASCFDISNWI